MHDVEAAGAEREVGGLRVDDDVVPRLRGADQRDVGDRVALTAAGHVDDELLLGAARVPGPHDPSAAQDEPLGARGHQPPPSSSSSA